MKLIFESWRKHLEEAVNVSINKIKDLACPPATQNLELNTKNRDAAIKAAESLLATEEDDDLYVPIINTLRADYSSGLNMLGIGAQGSAKPAGQQKQQKQMQDLFQQMLERQK